MRITNISEANLKTGDILFTRGKTFRSKLQQYLFGSFINHCAMVFIDDDGVPWVWDTSLSCGAYMTRLSSWLASNWNGRNALPQSPPIGLRVPYISPQFESFYESKSQLFLKRLSKPLDTRNVLRFLQANIGRPYSLRLWKRAWERAGGDLFLLPIPNFLVNIPTNGLYCSELVIKTLEAGGALTFEGQPLPDDLWQNKLQWKSGYSLSETERLTITLGQENEIDTFGMKNSTKNTKPSGPTLDTWIRGALAKSPEKQLSELFAHVILSSLV
jgi:hypothetical protein